MEFYNKENFTTGINPQDRERILETLKHIVQLKGRRPLGNRINRPLRPAVAARRILAVVIAASTGGPKALTQFCGQIPGTFPAPIILVQHNTTGFDRGFAQWLKGYTALKVKLAEEGENPQRGTLYVAPTDKHLTIPYGRFMFDHGEPVNNQKPAADVLFKSAACSMGGAVISVVLTGMGNDGAQGTRHIREAGGITIAQDEASSLIYGMPKAAFDTGCVDMVLPLDKIPDRLIELTKI